MKKLSRIAMIILAMILLINVFTIGGNFGPESALACNGGGCCPCNLTPSIRSCGFLWLSDEVVCVYGSGQCCPLPCQW